MNVNFKHKNASSISRCKLCTYLPKNLKCKYVDKNGVYPREDCLALADVSQK